MSRPAILAAITSLGHMIDEGRVILYHDPKKPGNALHQLADAVEAVIDAQVRREALRDEFAARALAAMLANPDKEGANRGPSGLDVFPGYAYEWADAMLKARSA
jgi:hypothetical protein